MCTEMQVRALSSLCNEVVSVRRYYIQSRILKHAFLRRPEKLNRSIKMSQRSNQNSVVCRRSVIDFQSAELNRTLVGTSEKKHAKYFPVLHVFNPPLPLPFRTKPQRPRRLPAGALREPPRSRRSPPLRATPCPPTPPARPGPARPWATPSGPGTAAPPPAGARPTRLGGSWACRPPPQRTPVCCGWTSTGRAP